MAEKLYTQADLEALLREARCDEIRQFLNKLPPLGAIRSVESLEDWIHSGCRRAAVVAETLFAIQY